jgi:hypothetical protein
MTWRELAEQIQKLPDAQKEMPVRFVEPYDDGEGWDLSFYLATQDIHRSGNPNSDDEPFIREGEFYLG